ncbi:rhodanese-like domain-containing protein [Puteibacter caeruleilacunae]|nr:rhodanese-like domain-containing protein [Puteibacter caeruleilacunae]
MNNLDNVIEEMDFQYFGTGQHKIEPEQFLTKENTVFLDVRAKEETETVKFNLEHHCEVLEIPTDEVPARINEIPKVKLIGVFCSAGVRAAIIFTFLRSKGYQHVKIIPGGYPPLMQAIMPGKLYKQLNK